jgi:peroxiredoxin Q/BCP
VGVVGVSGDPQEKNDRFRESLELPFPLVGDPDGTVLRAYKARWPLIGLAQRVTYVVGRDRTIEQAFRSEKSMTDHAVQACEFVVSKAE